MCSGHTVDDMRVFQRACTALAAAGYDVHLIAQGSETAPFQSSGVTIHPLAKNRSRRERLARRVEVAKLASRLRPDLLHVHEPELLGPTISYAQGRPVVWDVHESFMDVLAERKWIPRWLRPIARLAWDRRERTLLRRCAGVVVVTERIAQRYRRLHRRVVVVGNYPDLSLFLGLSSPERDGRTCVFAGVLTPDRGLLQAIQALGLLNRRDLAIRLELAGPQDGNFADVLLAQAQAHRIGDLVTYHGVLSKRAAIEFQNRGSIGLVPYLPVANSMASMANKLLECMALGLPVVFSDFPNYREVAGEPGAGLAVDPTQPKQIADAIECLAKDASLARRMGQAGQRAVRERFNWEIERSKLLALYREVLGPPPERAAASCVPFQQA